MTHTVNAVQVLLDDEDQPDLEWEDADPEEPAATTSEEPASAEDQVTIDLELELADELCSLIQESADVFCPELPPDGSCLRPFKLELKEQKFVKHRARLSTLRRGSKSNAMWLNGVARGSWRTPRRDRSRVRSW